MNDDEFFILERVTNSLSEECRLLHILARDTDCPALAEASDRLDGAYAKTTEVLVDYLKRTEGTEA